MSTGYIVLAVFFTSAMALFIAGAATSFVVYESATTIAKSTFWQTCTSVNGGDYTCADIAKQTCDDLQMTIDAGKSWGIITTVLGGLVAAVAVARAIKTDLLGSTSRIFFIIFIFIALIASVLQWIIAFAAYASSFCGTKLRDNANMTAGPQGPLFFVGSVLIFVGVILEFIYGAPLETTTTGATKEEPTTVVAAPATAAATTA